MTIHRPLLRMLDKGDKHAAVNDADADADAAATRQRARDGGASIASPLAFGTATIDALSATHLTPCDKTVSMRPFSGVHAARGRREIERKLSIE